MGDHSAGGAMPFREITDPQAVLRAMQEFDELGRDAFLEEHGFGPARNYFVEHEGRRYDSKALYGVAHGYQYPELGNLRSDEFSGGEATVKRRLEALGFAVVALEDAAVPIADVIAEILALQHRWSRENTDDMRDRGRLVRREAPRSVRGLLPPPSTLPFAPSVEGQDGTGGRSRVPFVRVFSQHLSPSATVGWYVVLLFAADGSAAYLALITGTTMERDGHRVLRPRGWVEERVAAARQVLGDVHPHPGLHTTIELRDPGELGSQYERGTVCAFRYPVESLPDDSAFAAHLATLLSLLSVVYSDSEDDSAMDATAGPEAIHLLLKWNPKHNTETVRDHEEVAARHGSVWWGNWTTGTNRMPDHRVQRLKDQIGRGVPTYAFLYRTGSAPAVWRATMHDVTNRRDDVDDALLPAYYGPSQQHSVYVRLGNFEVVPLEWAYEHLALAKDPVAGSLPPALRSQTTPLYVVVIGDERSAGGGKEPLLTKEWLHRHTLWPPAVLDEMLEALLGPKPQVLLAGPPGTGKSYLAKALARYVTEDRAARWRLVQLHPGYGYESLMQGLRPVVGDHGISFELVEGTVPRMAEAARLDGARHVLVLDELNRANIPRVLGELLYLFEYRDEMIDLQYSPGFALPKKLSFIGTMNTADRSIRSIDVALRRRFEIFECLPDVGILDAYYQHPDRESFVPDLLDGFVALNQSLETQLDRHHTIGHTFFMHDEMTPARLRRTWARQLLPLVEEYFFDLPEVVAEFRVEKFWPSLGA